MELNLKLNDEIEIEIIGIANGGEGVGRYNNFVVFVPYSAMNDVLKVKITEISKSFARAKIIEIKKPSSDRITPICKYFYGIEKEIFCGGCDFMHIDYKKQLEYKEKFVLNAIEKIGKIDKNEFVWEGIIGNPHKNVFGYRNKLQLPLATDEKGIAYLGFFAPNTHSVVKIEECHIQPKELNIISQEFIRLVNKEKIAIYDEKKQTNGSNGFGLRHLCLRINKNKEVLLTIVGTYAGEEHKDILAKIKSLAQTLFNDWRFKKNIKGIIYNVNRESSNFVFGRDEKFWTICGVDEISENIGDINYKISSPSFFQVNTNIAEKLYANVKNFIDPKGNEKILDLYCGSGGIGLFIAKNIGKLVGVEVIKQAAENAAESAFLNGIKNAVYYCAKVEEILEEILEEIVDEKFDIVILNPPRKGVAEEVIVQIDKIKPKKIIYVSCNPTTLARDLKRFRELGYKLKKGKSFDMFPQTSNVETLVEIEKK